ncbi:MAG TPA: hypothetical protein VKB62_11740 [Streptosporangiaceae bacterium]|nr:hypothetical protein [Streptosporangiaceae bacterium]
MDDVASIPRSRGVVCGVLLILLGVWGGLAPFVGHYLHFGFTPDDAWKYTTGRLYLSAIPGAAALLGGLMVLITRNRAFGISGGILGALGGGWFIIGSGFVTAVLKNNSVTIGAPLQSANMTAALQTYLENEALFFGLGALILFFAALAIGRFSMLAAKDVEAVEADGYSYSRRAEQFPAPTGD